MKGSGKLCIPILLVTAMPSLAQAPAVQITPTNDTGVARTTSTTVPMGSVNLVNGNLSIALPLITLPGRGGAAYPLTLQYDSKLWAPHVSFPSPDDAQVQWQYEKQAYPVGLGWHLNIPVINNAGFVNDDNGYIWGLGYFVITMPDGSKHSIAGAVTGLDSEDGEDIHLEAGYIPDYAHGYQGIAQDITVTTGDGARIHFPSDGAPADKITDRNGNYVLIGSTSITDSAGHQITLVSGSNGYTAVKYTDSNGQEQTINLNYSQTLLFSTDGNSTQYTSATPYQYPLPANNVCYSICYAHVWVSQPVLNTTWGMLSSVGFPNGDTYSFTYNGYGELTKIVYPGGGYARYDFNALSHGEAYWLAAGNITADFREVTAQYLCPQTSCSPSQEQKTSYTADLTHTPDTDQGANEQMTVVDPMGNKSWHKFWHSTGSESTAESVHSPPQEVEAKYYDGASTLLKRTITGYPQYNGLTIPLANKVTTLFCKTDGSAVSTVTALAHDTPTLHFMGPGWGPYIYSQPTYATQPINGIVERDVYGLVASSNCDSDTPSQGSLLRKETTTFLSSDANHGTMSLAHTPTFPSIETTYDANNNIAAQTTYEYDIYSGSSHAALIASGASQLDSAPGGSYRGNVTAVTKMVDSSNSVTSYSQYYDTGSLHIAIDPKGNQTTYGYGADYLFPTTVKDALNYTDSYTYYGSTGQVHTHTDLNQKTTTYGYDSGLRLSSVTLPPDPNNGNASGGVSFSHVSPNLVKQYTTQSSGIQVEKDYIYDGLGRQTETQLMDPDHHTCSNGVIYTDTTYDNSGRVSTVSNPFCSTGDSTYGLTTTQYDGVNRKTHIYHPGNSSISWAYSGNVIDSYDETSRHRQQLNDALGQLVIVLEPDPSSNIPSLETDYQYNGLGDLVRVDQWGGSQGSSGDRIRQFQYDSLSRLTYACNSESLPNGSSCDGSTWSTVYQYDLNSNLHTKTDLRGVTITYNYDALSRLSSKTYSGGSAAATLSSCYQYDASTNGTGRLSAEWTQAGTCPSSPPNSPETRHTIVTYDVMGRVTADQQCHRGKCSSGTPAVSGMHYDLAGNLTSYSNGFASIEMGQTYDAAGRLQSIGSSLYGSQYPSYPATLLSVGANSPAGSIQNMNFGPVITVTRSYDSRLRITGQSVTHP